MLWRPFCPPFWVTDMSEINFMMLNRFLDLKNLYVATKIMCLAQILKKILRILSFGGHLGRHLKYFNFPNDAKVASFSFNVRTYWRTHLCKNILCGLLFWVAPKIFIWQPDYIAIHLFIVFIEFQGEELNKQCLLPFPSLNLFKNIMYYVCK